MNYFLNDLPFLQVFALIMIFMSSYLREVTLAADVILVFMYNTPIFKWIASFGRLRYAAHLRQLFIEGLDPKYQVSFFFFSEPDILVPNPKQMLIFFLRKLISKLKNTSTYFFYHFYIDHLMFIVNNL